MSRKQATEQQPSNPGDPDHPNLAHLKRFMWPQPDLRLRAKLRYPTLPKNDIGKRQSDFRLS